MPADSKEAIGKEPGFYIFSGYWGSPLNESRSGLDGCLGPGRRDRPKRPSGQGFRRTWPVEVEPRGGSGQPGRAIVSCTGRVASLRMFVDGRRGSAARVSVACTAVYSFALQIGHSGFGTMPMLRDVPARPS